MRFGYYKRDIMIESIADLSERLKVIYNNIYQILSNIRVGNNKFATIISEHLETSEGVRPLNIISEYSDDSPLRMQLRDISGIA
jgi:hypothetical protein